MSQKLVDFLTVFSDTSKTAIMVILLGLASFFRVNGYVDGSGFVELMKTTTIAYFGTTTMVGFTDMIKGHLEAKLKSITAPSQDNS